MKKIVIISKGKEVNREWVALLQVLFPECKICVCPDKGEDEFDGSFSNGPSGLRATRMEG